MTDGIEIDDTIKRKRGCLIIHRCVLIAIAHKTHRKSDMDRKIHGHL